MLNVTANELQFVLLPNKFLWIFKYKVNKVKKLFRTIESQDKYHENGQFFQII